MKLWYLTTRFSSDNVGLQVPEYCERNLPLKHSKPTDINPLKVSTWPLVNSLQYFDAIRVSFSKCHFSLLQKLNSNPSPSSTSKGGDRGATHFWNNENKSAFRHITQHKIKVWVSCCPSDAKKTFDSGISVHIKPDKIYHLLTKADNFFQPKKTLYLTKPDKYFSSLVPYILPLECDIPLSITLRTECWEKRGYKICSA